MAYYIFEIVRLLPSGTVSAELVYEWTALLGAQRLARKWSASAEDARTYVVCGTDKYISAYQAGQAISMHLPRSERKT